MAVHWLVAWKDTTEEGTMEFNSPVNVFGEVNGTDALNQNLRY
jgi:hypothetical protein